MPLDKDAAVSPPSPTAYRDELFKLGSATIDMQGRALVAQTQQNLSVLSDPTGVGAAAAKTQSGLRDAAGFSLDVMLPRLVGTFTNADSVTNLVRALNSTLAGVTEPKQAQDMIAKVAGQMRDYAGNLEDTANMARQNLSATQKATSALDAAIAKAVAALDGGDGEIAAARAAITRTEADVSQAISDIVKNSNIVGDGVKNLARYVLSVILPAEGGGTDKTAAGATAAGATAAGAIAADKAGADKAASTTTDTASKPDAAKPAGDKAEGDGGKADGAKGNNAGGKIEPFPVDSITTIAAGAEGLTGAEQALAKGSQLLNSQYQELAALSSMLAAVQAIRSQAGTMGTTAEAAVKACDDTASALAALANAYDDLAKRAADASGVAQVTAELNGQIAAWTRLRDQISAIEVVLSGGRSLFPPLPR